MIVAGGVYIERCLTPLSVSLMGSGGRAAVAISALGANVNLHTFSPSHALADIEANYAPYGINIVAHESSATIEFSYLHPLSHPRVRPIPLPAVHDVMVQSEVVLRFGCLEGSFIADAKTAVYDPQSGWDPSQFRANGSKAQRLAVVLNSHEARLMSGASDLHDAAAFITRADGAEVVIIKDGPAGAHVFCEGSFDKIVPPYQSEGVFKIGSGDVFTAVFAHYWSAGTSPNSAADLASQHTAHYVTSRQFSSSSELPKLQALGPVKSSSPRIFVIGDSSTAPGVWLLEEAKQALLDLGAHAYLVSDVRPELAIGAEVEASDIRCYDAALALLPQSDSAMAAVRGALAQDVPVVAFAQPEHLRAALTELGCRTEDDLATALYAVMWLTR